MSEPHFDRCQFDPKMRPGSYASELLTFRQTSIFGEERLDASEPIAIVSERRSVRPDAAMFADMEIVRLVLLAAFPKLQEDKTQRLHAKTWLKVLRLYWHVGAPVSHIAKESRKTENEIKCIIKRIRGKARLCTGAA